MYLKYVGTIAEFKNWLAVLVENEQERDAIIEEERTIIIH